MCVWWFQPIWKICASQIGWFPQIFPGWFFLKKKNPPPRYGPINGFQWIFFCSPPIFPERYFTLKILADVFVAAAIWGGFGEMVCTMISRAVKQENVSQLTKKWEIHPGKLTWNLTMNPWKRRFLLETIIFRFHVGFRGGIWSFKAHPCFSKVNV